MAVRRHVILKLAENARIFQGLLPILFGEAIMEHTVAFAWVLDPMYRQIFSRCFTREVLVG